MLGRLLDSDWRGNFYDLSPDEKIDTPVCEAPVRPRRSGAAPGRWRLINRGGMLSTDRWNLQRQPPPRFSLAGNSPLREI